MQIDSDRVAYDGKYIQLVERSYVGRDGKPKVWEMIRRKTFGRVVAIAAITADGNIILEKGFRIPFKDYVLELPAGIMDRAGETEEDTVRRELLEETGYVVDRVVPLVSGPFDSGLTMDEISLFGGTNARKVAEPAWEASEEIEVISIPVRGMIEFIHAHPDMKVDVKIVGVLPFLKEAGLIN